ncbi:MAG: HlyC/CorC family transporter [Planctomycetes bacterium]|nr:HlyC/CorC family transporter [Planctomycetota bacterium]
MDPATAAFWIGVAVVILTFCWIAYVSVVSDALHGYAFSLLFDLIPDKDEATQRKFEKLCRNDDEFIQVAETGRIIGFVLHFTGWMVIIMPQGVEFQIDHLLIAGLLSIISLLVCVVIVPPLILRHREEAALLVLLPFFAVLALVFKPFTIISSSVRRMGARIEGVDVSETAKESFEEDLADSLEGAEREGVLDEEEREMIQKVVELGETPASRAMIPRTDMVCADVTEGVDGALKLAVKHGHSRVPVFEGDRDHIIGVFYTRDLVPTWNVPPEQKKLQLRNIIRPAHFWPASKVLDDLLREMREDRLKIAILTDEHGGTAGMITLEDILEEIVGDIHDEYDEGEVERAHRAILPFHKNEAEADGDVDLDELNKVLEIDLPEAAEYNSVGGLLLHHLGRLAVTGDEIDIGDLKLTVIDADERRIKRVKITRTSDITETEVKH